MSALVCDMCGGKLKVTNGGLAVCESCGVEHSIERIQKKYSDNAHLVNNFFAIARDSYDQGNNVETEKYCNKILEIDFKNSEAQLLKGKAVCWQSSIDFFRFEEAAGCFANALNYCIGVSNRASLHKSVQDEFKGIATALIKIRCDRFQKWLDQEETDGFKNDLDELSKAFDSYDNKTGEKLNREYIFNNVSPIVHTSIADVFLSILLEYRLSVTKSAYLDFVTKTDHCIAILEKTIDLCNDDNSYVQLNNQCIEMMEAIIQLNKEDMIRDRWGAYKKTPRMSYDEVSRRKHKIQEYQLMVNNKILGGKNGNIY